ncbi:MAG: DUF3179 domain-containing protein [Pseudomonadales bacterium]|nr:DUF3179 domain-containing protein [Pseudomonadales bacterium]
MIRVRTFPIVILLALGFVESVFSANKNGFDLDSALIPSKEIRRGGPPRDGIPSIDHPKFVSTTAASHMQPGDRILGYIDGRGMAFTIEPQIEKTKVSNASFPVSSKSKAFHPDSSVYVYQ